MKKVKDKDFIKNYAICIKIFGFFDEKKQILMKIHFLSFKDTKF